jgi:hypothetical protein
MQVGLLYLWKEVFAYVLRRGTVTGKRSEGRQAKISVLVPIHSTRV